MKLRHKLLVAFGSTVFLCVLGVAWSVTALVRHAFDNADEQRTSALVAQFRREFDRRGEEVGARVDAIARSEIAARMAASLGNGPPDYGANLNQAKTIAESEQLDFLEFVDRDGAIISSAQWPAKFGYNEGFPLKTAPVGSFLHLEQLPDGSALSLSAVRSVSSGDNLMYVMGGHKVDKEFLASLDVSSGTRAFFYENLQPVYSAQFLIAASTLKDPSLLAPLIQGVQQSGKEKTAIIRWSSAVSDDEAVDAIPLTGADRQVLGVLLVANSRRLYVELQQKIRSAALISGGAGMALAILLSGWVAARVTRPVEELARAAKQVAAGHWNAQVNIASADELAELAESFNRMTRQLLEQKERLVQSERVAAWREVARRLAHELKNPLFPLQLTVENLTRAREQTPEQFDEIFRESTTTLLAEIANLKTIVARFSEFSRMPQPNFRQVQLNDVLREAVRLFQPQLTAPGRPAIQCRLELFEAMESIAADPELLHRAISNLILNAIDAMPGGGMLRLHTRQEKKAVFLEISDTGTGLTAEQRQHLFTPYYSTKTSGTGLGLAIVQSVVSDHQGTISVQSKPGEGTTFTIELPENSDKLRSLDAAGLTSG
jgi:signal transduction histidine kinase